MIVQQTDNIAFGYHSVLKTQYLKGNLKSVKYGFYGDRLNNKNVSLEHLLPKSKGGKSKLTNFVLASRKQNWKRGNDDIKQHIDKPNAMRYLLQFVGVKTRDFDGNSYIKDVLNTLRDLGVDLLC
jgi:hypothetical protein